MPKVSVIIPVYGVEKYIERCAVSLFEQTLYDIEYIFVNDCTKDNSMKVLADVITRYPDRKSQIRIINLSINEGLPSARRHGLSLASGEYIIHCDSDDWVEIDMYKSMYDKAIETGSDIVVCDYNKSESISNFKYINQSIPLEKNKFINGLLDGTVPGFVVNKLVKASLYNNVQYFPKDNFTEDMVITTQLVYYAEHICHIEKGFYHYFTNSESISQKRIDAYHTLKMGKQCFNNFNIIYNFLSCKPDFADFASNITLRKYRIKLFLRNICRSKGGFKRWRSIFPELSPFSVFKYHLPWRTKIGYIITCMGIYSCLSTLDKSIVDAIMIED